MHIVKLLMFSVLPTKLLPGRYNLYGNSLEIQVKYMKEKKNHDSNLDDMPDDMSVNMPSDMPVDIPVDMPDDMHVDMCLKMCPRLEKISKRSVSD